MYRIQTLNRISAKGLDLFPRDRYEVASEFSDPDAILLRSYEMNGMELPPNLKAVSRAGAGTNNIPVDRCTERGIVVFNTPGANANSVKELVLAGIFLASRQIFQGMNWTRSILDRDEEIPLLVEREKNRFAGPEIMGKRLGVIGLGAIGVMVANSAISLGMKVSGFDPFISVESAWGLYREVKRSVSLDMLLAESDYITLHVPLNDQTRGMIDAHRLQTMKPGVRLLNFARGGLVNNGDLLEAIRAERVACYVTDFPEADLVREERVLTMPHIGASTPEAEENCAVMAVRQLREFLETGNITNSANFPDCRMEPTENKRIVIANRNIPNMMGQITSTLAAEGINILDYLNRHRGEVAYNIIDVENGTTVPPHVIDRLRAIDGIIMVRAVGEENTPS